MAKNVGLLQFVGKLGGISGRVTPYGTIVSTPGGFKGDRIRTEDRYLVTRQLGTEFGRCSKVASKLHSCLVAYLKMLSQHHVYGTIQARLTAIKACDVIAPKGERSVGAGLHTEAGRALLLDFGFSAKKGLRDVVSGGYAMDMEAGRLTFMDFGLKEMVLPKGAQSVGLELLLLRLDTETPDCKMETSGLSLFLKDDLSGRIVLDCAVPEGDGFLIGVCYVMFCDVVNGDVYGFRTECNVLDVVGVL